MPPRQLLQLAFTGWVSVAVTVGCADSDNSDQTDDDARSDSRAVILEAGKRVMIKGAAGESFLYKFTVPSDFKFTRMRFRMENPTGDADLLVRRGRAPTDDTADFFDEDNDGTAVGSDCFWFVCSDIGGGSVDPVVRYDVFDPEPGTYFAMVVNGDGAHDGSPDNFEATLGVQTYSDVQLEGQTLALEIDKPISYFGPKTRAHAFFDIKVPPGHKTVRVTIQDTSKENWDVDGFLYARKASDPFVESEIDWYGVPDHWDAAHENQLDLSATEDTWHIEVMATWNGGVFGTITATLDP